MLKDFDGSTFDMSTIPARSNQSVQQAEQDVGQTGYWYSTMSVHHQRRLGSSICLRTVSRFA